MVDALDTVHRISVLLQQKQGKQGPPKQSPAPLIGPPFWNNLRAQVTGTGHTFSNPGFKSFRKQKKDLVEDI